MVSFVCSPLSIDGLRRSGKFPQGNARELAGHRSSSRQGKIGTSCKLRNRGGFNLPPKVPPPGDERVRATELLGCCTQRKRMRSSTIAELKALIGDIPPNRLVAQQWKGAIRRDEKKATQQVDPNAFRHRHLLLENLRLPEKDKTLSRCFILLDCLRRRYHAKDIVTPRVLDELTAILGSYPKSTKEAHHYIRTLAYLNRERRARERRPPQMPFDSFEDLQYASMLLGTYAVRGSVGSQTGKLNEILGAVPRNRNVATWWKKAVAAAIRKKKRKERAAEKRIEDEAKRIQRRLKKLERERKEDVVPAYSNGQPSPNLGFAGEVLNGTEACAPIHHMSASTYVAHALQDGSTSYFSRLYTFLGRFLRSGGKGS